MSERYMEPEIVIKRMVGECSLSVTDSTWGIVLRCDDFGSSSGLYSGGLTWSIELRCDDHTGIFTCVG